MSFRCRLCGSDRFEQVTVRRADGSLYRSALLACAGCSLVFTDPDRFAQPVGGVVRLGGGSSASRFLTRKD